MRKTLLLLFIVCCTHVDGQVFPVQVSVQLAPPYSPWLSDYTMPGGQKLTVQIRANDVTVSDYLFRLQLIIEGQGITIRTKPTLVTAPFVLQGGGIPQIYYGEDLSDYFHPDALDFAGLSRSAFIKSGRLPEGLYRFSVSVLDYNRGTVVSNTAIATAWIVLNDPPVLNVPANASTLEVRDPANILFGWTPRHMGSPNAAFTTEYTFRLVEIWPENRNPHDAFLTQPTLFETTTSQNQILYTANDPALIPGRKYAWQLTARDTEGRDLFRNDGRSEVFSFQYGKELPVPERFQLRWAKPTTLSMRWDSVMFEGHEVKYRLFYRPLRRQENHAWYETLTQFTQKTLYHLAVNTEYEMKVRAETAMQESAFSPVRVFRTLRDEASEFVCKDLVEPPPRPDDTKPVFPMQVNDTLHVGGYDVLVRDVVQMNNRYFGSGVAIVPWLNDARIRVTFEDIRVNDAFWLTRGSVKTVWSSESRFLGDQEVPHLPGYAPKAGALDITVISVDSLITIEGAAIASVSKDEEGSVVVTLTDGKQQTLAKNESYAITDAVGNGYVVDKEGNVAKTTAMEAHAAAARGRRIYEAGFVFSQGSGQFGFDEKKHDALAHYYQQLDDGTYAAWKALSTAQPDDLEGRLQSTQISVSQLEFVAGNTLLAPSHAGAGRVTFRLQGKMAGVEEELVARYQPSDTIPARVFGKVNLTTYDPIHYNLEIVPVNGASLPGGLNTAAVSKSLNSVYMQAVVEWHVTISNGITVDLPAGFDAGEKGVFSNYTGDMKKVLKAYGRLQDNTYYIFLIDQALNPDILGYMPRSRQAGFVFVVPHEGNTSELLKTIGHELGHGAFNLEHTFLEHGLAMGTTDNLMDYSSGTKLSKYQWDYIHEPRGRIPLFEGGEESAMTSGPLASHVKAFSLHESYYAVGDGLIPEYLWKSGLVSPVVAGFVDGMWETIEGAWGIANFLDAWQPNNFSADALQIRLATWQFVQFLNELATSVEARDQVWIELRGSFVQYIDETLDVDHQALYNQGRLVFDVASLFVGVGEIKALLKGQGITLGVVSVLNAVPKNVAKFIFKARRLGLSVVRDANRLLIKDGPQQIARVSDNVLHPEVFLDDGEQMFAEGGHTLVKNREGRMGFLRGEVKKFTIAQIDAYVEIATKQNDKVKVMLGMWDGGGSSSYVAKAGKDYCYFDFGDRWDEAYNLVGRNDDEMWKINKEFIDRQRTAGKEFWLSHDPFSPKNEQFYAREVNYLIDLKVRDFKKIGNLWKAIW